MKKFLYSFLILLSTTFTIKILNFVRELELSYFFGTDSIVDEFLKMSILPNIILNSLAPALGIYLMTIIVQSNNKKINIDYMKIFSIFCFLVILFLLNFYFLIGSNYHLIFNSSILLFLYVIQVVLVYYHHAHNNFIVGAVTSNIQAIVILLVILLTYLLELPNIIFYSITLGLLIQIVLLCISINKNSYFIQIAKVKDVNFYKNILSIFLGIGLIEILISISKIFIEIQMINGGLAIFNYAFKLANLPNSIIIFALVSVLFPKLAKISEKKILLDLNKSLTDIIIGFFSIISLIVILFSEQIVTLIYGRGQFNQEDIYNVSVIFILLIIVMIFVSVITIQYRVIYLNNNFKSIIINSIIQILLLLILLIINLVMFSDGIFIVTSLIIVTFTGMILNFKILNYKNMKFVIICISSILIMYFNDNIYLGLLLIIILFIMTYRSGNQLLKESKR